MRKRAALSARSDPIHANRRLALADLLAAYDVAQETGRNPWAYACQIMTLQSHGVTETTLRWLVDQNLSEHLLETTKPTDRARAFQLCLNDHLAAESCFCLTSAGLFAAREAGGNRQTHAPVHIRPRYDSAQRSLFFEKRVIKQFRVPAPNQELILRAFEEESWPPRIDDPLPPAAGIDGKKRLHDAIHRLNHRLKPRLIRFFGDGTGCGVLWQACESLTTD